MIGFGGIRRRQPSTRASVRSLQRGAAAVEFALVVIPILYIVFGAMSYAYMFSFRQALSQSASEGARAAVGAYDSSKTCSVSNPSTWDASTKTNCPAQYAAAQAVKNSLETYGKSCGTSATSGLTCTILVGDSSTVSGCTSGHTCISLKVNYPYRDANLLPAVPGFGYLLPKNLSFTSVVQLN